ncbi:DUF1330 domain-containing protein [Tropicibacter sp. R16_0]|uniref:DUF1330 domain-containing protein n=1 Tax=Tropicibacter sp. R16_0 TaxID=2821102 RepID=UPI001ADB9481|nr:DUF1330 domain-containing protein [Tropicibacter sp. R16_0]MBO9452049.1 DUF1330 domain-containing protein [Tropicibacter sp. R16_0]
MPTPKPAYLVASSFMPEGHGPLDAYAEATHPLLEKWGGELIIAGETGQFMDHFEGNWSEDARFTLFRFPSMDALQGFWRSDEYQAVKHLRTDVLAPNFTFAVEGFDPAEWAEQNPDHVYNHKQ